MITLGQKLPSEKRKKEIIEAALEIIDEGGFSSLTLRKIAHRNKITEAAIYRHFQNKKDIIDHLCSILFIDNPVISSIQKQGQDPFSLLEEAMERQLAWIEANPKFTAILFQEELFLEYPDIREKFNFYRGHKEKTIEQLIFSAQQKGIVAPDVDPQIFALLYMGSIRISVLRWRSENFSYSLKGEAKKLTGELFKLLKPGI